MYKKGEMSLETIVSIIVLVIGLGILLFLYMQFNWTGTVDHEVCHQSVIVRATLPATAGVQNYVPLKCKTDKICITSGFIGGSCKEYQGASGVMTVKVSDVNQVEKTIAENMIDCWKMMGEGKVSIFSQWVAQTYSIPGFSTVYPSCVICTRIAFDTAGLAKNGIDLSKMDVMQYMKTRAIPGGNISYFDYLAGENGKTSVADISLNFQPLPTAIPSTTAPSTGADSTSPTTQPTTQTATSSTQPASSTPSTTSPADSGTAATQPTTPPGEVTLVPVTQAEIKAQSTDSNLQSHELAIMFMQISSPTHAGTAKTIAETIGGLLAASFITSPGKTSQATSAVYKLCTSSGWSLAACSAALVVVGVVQQGTVAYNRAITAGYCGDVSVGSEARDGCSVVRTTNYDVNGIKQYCSVIESLP